MGKGETPAESYPSLAKERQSLGNLYDAHTRTAGGFLAATETAYAADLFFVGVIQRSLHLTQGFLWAFDHWNVIVAAPLVRLQLDNLTRVSYVARHPDLHTMSMRTLDEEFRSMKDEKGKLLNDSRLVELAKPHHPWLPKVYRQASGWVHLSPDLLMLPFRVDEESPGRLNISIRHVIDDYPESFLSEVLGSMTRATGEVLAYASLWEYRKANPTHSVTKTEA